MFSGLRLVGFWLLWVALGWVFVFWLVLVGFGFVRVVGGSRLSLFFWLVSRGWCFWLGVVFWLTLLCLACLFSLWFWSLGVVVGFGFGVFLVVGECCWQDFVLAWLNVPGSAEGCRPTSNEIGMGVLLNGGFQLLVSLQTKKKGYTRGTLQKTGKFQRRAEAGTRSFMPK